MVLNFLDTLQVTDNNIRLWKQKDLVLEKFKQLMVVGKNEGLSQPEQKSFWTRRDQITVEDSTLLSGASVVVLSKVTARYWLNSTRVIQRFLK